MALTTHPPVQKLSGDAAIALRPADCVFPQAFFEKPAHKTQHNHTFFLTTRKSGKPRSRPRHREDYNSPEKFRMECVLEKPVAPLLPSPPPAGQFSSTNARCSTLTDEFAQVGEWLKPTDCKSVPPSEVRRFESFPVHQRLRRFAGVRLSECEAGSPQPKS